MAPRTGPCEGGWPLGHCDEDTESPGVQKCAALANLDPVQAQLVEDAAVEYLWNWTGKRFGTCSVTIRPCQEACLGDMTTYRGWDTASARLPHFGGQLSPALVGGQWFNFGCSGCGERCSCSFVSEVALPQPVSTVTEVRLDGAVFPEASWRVDNNRYLVRTDGGQWPHCQDMTSDPATDPDTFSVTYDIGTPAPAGGQVAAGVLACELAKAACGAAGCRLPQRVQSITRQGVTAAFLDTNADLWTNGATGLFAVDSWVASVNSPSRTGGRIMSPDTRAVRRTTQP